MRKTKAAFKAMREKCGLAQRDIADEFDVTVDSVKKWENPRYQNDPPDEVWDWLLDAVGAMELDARELAERVIETAGGGGSVVLDYMRTQEQLDAIQLPDADESVGYYNARMRLVADIVQEAGVEVTFAYPD